MNDKDSLVKVTLNMPKSNHRKLKAIAALKGIGLSTYIMECLENVVFRANTKEGVNEESPSVDNTIKTVEELIETQPIG